MPGRYICQWDKDGCDDARFIKIDFLALGMLSLVEECLELIWQCRGEKVDLGSIPYDDPAVYDAICRGDTVGLFQIESRAQIQMLTRTQPRNLDDLAVQVAIVRPGPIVGGAVNPYVQRRERLRTQPGFRPRADHPLLDDLLSDTLGVVLYQDQVLEVAIEMGGFSPGQADQFRRAMSRRRSKEAMAGFRDAFLAGARRKGVSPADAAGIFDRLYGFSEFGFPKSHAYAFAVLAYQSAWLRHYHPAEYYAALLNNQPMGFYAPHVLIGDARRHHLQVLRVALNRSVARCVPTAPDQILLGLSTVRSLGEDAARAVVAERDAHGPYRSLPDLLRRTDLPRQAVENLIMVGALAEFGLARRELLWQLGLLSPQSSVVSRRRRQLALALPTEQDMVRLKDLTDWERMLADYGMLGLSPSYHPLALLRPDLPSEVLTAEQVRASRDGARVRTAGLVVCRQRPGTAKGFVFLLLEDETGLVNVVVRPDLYDAQRSTIRGEPYLCIEGTVQSRSGTLNLLATRATPLNRARAMPHAPERNSVPGNPHDPREQASLALATPASRDFH
jgi:error-prone DNA polymerase